MEALKQRWQVWSIRFDALSFRERILVFFAMAGIALSLMFVGLIEPELKRQERMLESSLALQQEISGLREQWAAIERESRTGIDSEAGRLRAEADALTQQIKAREARMVAPAKMVAMLRALVAAQPGLTLTALVAEPGQPASPAEETAGESQTQSVQPSSTPPPPLYAHGVTVQVQGSYALLADYVSRLEHLPWTVRWHSVRIDASRHPRLELTLKLSTLSREPEWAWL